VLALAAVAGLAISACSGASGGSSAGSASADSSGPAPILVVASTNVWGDVVEQVGGDHVQVTSVISDPNADPHAYQANAQNQLVLSKAALVVENGGGYDDFMQTMLASGSSGAPVINAVAASGLTAADGELNEHVWYDLPGTTKVADAVAEQLAALDPGDAADYRANAAAFDRAVGALSAQVQTIKAAHAGTPVAITEPVPLYLIEAAGLVNVTPEQFSSAIENETDVPAAVMDQTRKLFTDKQVAALVYNEQTSGPQTQTLVDAAKANGIPVVPVTEILPDGQDYLTWMQSNIQALSRALGG
jgi:zinc/manganese transport system substrate-binding protein